MSIPKTASIAAVVVLLSLFATWLLVGMYGNDGWSPSTTETNTDVHENSTPTTDPVLDACVGPEAKGIYGSRSLRVVNDINEPVKVGTCYRLSLESIPVPYTFYDGSEVKLPESGDAKLAIEAKGHLTRIVDIHAAPDNMLVILPRLPTVELVVDNALGVSFAGARLELRLLEMNLPSSDLRRPSLDTRVDGQFLSSLSSVLYLTTDKTAKAVLPNALPGYVYSAKVIQGEHIGVEVKFSPSVGEKMTVRVPFGAGPFVSGRVLDVNNQPVEGAEVILTKVREGGMRLITVVGSANSRANGSFLLSPSEPEAKAPAYLHFKGKAWLTVKAIKNGQMLIYRKLISIEGDSTVLGDLIVGDGLSLRAKITAEGKPIGADCTLGFGVGSIEGVADDAGWFTISGISTTDSNERIILYVDYDGYRGVNIKVRESILANEIVEVDLLPISVQGKVRFESDEDMAMGKAHLYYRKLGKDNWYKTGFGNDISRFFNEGEYEYFTIKKDLATEVRTFIVEGNRTTDVTLTFTAGVKVELTLTGNTKEYRKVYFYDEGNKSLKLATSFSLTDNSRTVYLPPNMAFSAKVEGTNKYHRYSGQASGTIVGITLDGS